MARIVVTGATGLIGRAATATLMAQGHTVLAVSRSGVSVGGAPGLACDLRDPAGRDRVARQQAEWLLHLAWHDGADRWTSPANLDWLRASVDLVQRFAAAGGQRVVGVGSCAEYDWSHSLLSETVPLRPATPYGSAKAACGLALNGAAASIGLSVAWARVFFVFGPGEPRGRLFGDLIQGLAAGERVACTDGLQQRDFMHVSDLGDALAAVLNSDVTGAINVAHGTPIAVRDLIGEVAHQLQGADRVDLGARQRPPTDPDLLAADVTRLRDEVGFTPSLTWPQAVAATLAEDLKT